MLIWISDNTGARKEVTRSYYDKTVITGLPVDFTPNAETQRKRITHVTYEDVFDNNDQTFDHATHYDYDIHGNVKTLLQDNKKLATTYSTDADIVAQRFKRMDYNYDLISGNVHSVSYQNNAADQWHHAYEYDADNRITDVYTANNNMIALENGEIATPPMIGQGPVHTWDHDASYAYYSHGPLARTEIGDNQVQGTDYVYTLQGWIKGVNSNTLDVNRDPGLDGVSSSSLNQYFARDVYSYSLNYFAGDYQSIDASNHGINSFTASITGSDVEANRHDLFNGNIGSMITTITNPTTREILPLGNAYKYDQLNRLLQAKSYNNLDLDPQSLTYNQFGTAGTEMYFNAFEYDANGNILTQARKDHNNAAIDNLEYRYAKDGNGKMIQNRLYHVNDDTDYDGNDIDDMGAFDPTLSTINQNNNYSYTEIGELERDEQEDIEKIIWRVDSKVKEVHRSPTSSRKNLKFDYDAMGNRIAKHTYETNNTTLVKSTYYLRDAQGNVMSVYEHEVDNAAQTLVYKQVEKHIYGSSRLGMQTQEVIIYIPPTNPPTPTVTEMAYGRELGLKQYELSNHLGNVLTVITDKKIPIETAPNSQIIDYYIVEILSASDYSPFGVTLQEREFTSEKYRYGFNGMERDDEAKGAGNSYDFGARIYDNRLGRWLSLDGHFHNYPSYAPYCFSVNDPINKVDKDGNDVFVIIWATHLGHIGHVAIAVENYTIVEREITDIYGNVMKITEYQSTGTYTYYDNWPADDTKTGWVGQKDVESWRSKVVITEADLKTGNITEKYPREDIDGDGVVDTGIPGEIHDQNGVLKFESSPIQDMLLHTSLVLQDVVNPLYTGNDYNCAAYVSDALDVLPQFGEDLGLEPDVGFWWDAYTPNQVWRDVVSALETNKVIFSIIRDPGITVNNTFDEGYLDRRVGFDQTPEEREATEQDVNR